jgi:DNA polymerase-3 subunit alpha
MATHLMVRSAYSLLKGTMSIETIVAQAKRLNYTSLALTDYKTMYGVPEFMMTCQKNDIHPIIGLEIDIEINETINTMVLLAKNYAGYIELMHISTRLNTLDTVINISDINETKNLILILLSNQAIFEKCLLKQDLEALEVVFKDLSLYQSMMIGLSNQESPFYKINNPIIKKLAQNHHIKTVAMPSVLYCEAEDHELFRIISAIERQVSVTDDKLVDFPYRYMLSIEEITALYDIDDVKASDEIAILCNVEMQKGKTYLPKFECPKGLDASQYLTQLCLQGLLKRFDQVEVSNDYRQRLKDELKVIQSMHYEDYFLIVWDFIRFAKKEGIYVGPGRGSAAGSLVSYCLGITHVDPIKYGLLFERFLNSDRISLPDIDTDFPDNRRDEVLHYILMKYGSEHVAHISTFGTLAAKQVLRDVGRVMGLSVREMDSISKAVPNELKISLTEAYKNIRFKQLIDSDLRYTDVYQKAIKLEGLPRHISTHAAGIVFSSESIEKIVPLIRIEQDMLSTQYSMEYLEVLGLIKMDFLGLRNLTIIDDVVKLIDKHHHLKLDILKIPIDDEKTIQLVNRIDTLGIFQLESEGMKSVLKQMKVTRFEDIVATIALFRPGPMENIPLYIESRNKQQAIVYLHEDLKPIVADTYGVLIYQEQIMQVAQKMAGFTLAKADVLRKAMSKKNANELNKLKSEFIQGCLNKKYTEKLAEDLYALIFKFANYGFNKSHSVAYALISYQMAYLKANYPQLFYIALLNSSLGSDKASAYMSEAKSLKIMILPPNINLSMEMYALEDQGIRLPLLIIKGIGSAISREILTEREDHLFVSFYESVARLSKHKMSKAHFEALIDAGAFDDFTLNRRSMLASLDDALQYANVIKVKANNQIAIDLGLVSEPIPIVLAENPLQRSEREKNVLGFYLSDHPIHRLKQQYQLLQSIVDLKPDTKILSFIAMIKSIKVIRTKKGDMMCFLSVSDESGEMDCTLFPNEYSKYANVIDKGVFVMIEGQVEKEQSCLVKKLTILNQND